MRPARLALPLLAFLLACGSSGDGGSGLGHGALPAGLWSWVDVPGTTCGDGSPTGMAVNPGTDDRLLVFLGGGGACWDTVTCFELKSASPGPYAAAQFQADQARVPGSILDRGLAGNPYRDATLVFVPYCTGDVHWGDSTQTYPGAPRAWHHRGRANLAADLDWLRQNLGAPGRVVMSGSSAGGYGALLAFDLAKQRWPQARADLVDDSGPPLVGNDIQAAERAAWFVAWRLDLTLLPTCPECATDLSRIFPTLSSKYPGERLALLSSTQDQVISAFTLNTTSAFDTAVRRLADTVVNPLPSSRTFLVPGTSHTMLGTPAAFTSGGVGLLEWLRRMSADDPAWVAVGP